MVVVPWPAPVSRRRKPSWFLTLGMDIIIAERLRVTQGKIATATRFHHKYVWGGSLTSGCSKDWRKQGCIPVDGLDSTKLQVKE